MTRLLWTQKQDFGPKPRAGHAMAFDDARGGVVLFGGDSFHPGLFADTWQWDGENWTQTADMGPSPRADHALAFDSERRQAILFGGRGGAATMGDTWSWDGENWTQLADTGAAPRSRHAVAYDVNRKRIVLFGGRLADGRVAGDTWEWAGMDWTQVEDTGPAARAAHVMAYDSARGRTVLFGGEGVEQQIFGDTWEWTGQAWVQTAEFGATASSDAAMAFDGKGVALFGGVDSRIAAPGSQVFGNTWEWDGKHWTGRQDMGPGPRWHHAMAYDSKRQRMVLHGGLSVFSADARDLTDRTLGDTWEHSETGLNASAAEVTIKDFTISPTSFAVGVHAHGTITLTGPAPAGGAAVQLNSMVKGMNAYLINPPPPVVIPANGTSATFDLRTSPIFFGNQTGPDVIRAMLGAVSKDVSIVIV